MNPKNKRNGRSASLSKLGIRKIGPEVMGVSEYRLRNGLKILLLPNHSAPVVTFLIVYRVGSRNEAVGYTGATHFLEHMMFKGTRKFDPSAGAGLDDLLKLVGASYNATTWLDRTNYYEVVPSQYLELCIKLEADRMRNLRLRQEDRDSEMSVVRNELEMGENYPEQVMETQLYAMAFREHPYHHPTIGWRSDVEGVPMERLARFYNTFYWPDNATVIISGDFESEQALKLLNRHFGRITRAPRPIPEVYTAEPPQEGERRFEIHRGGDELKRFVVGYHTPESTHPDIYALSALSHVLGSSSDRSSRLYAALVDSGLCSEVSASLDEFRDPGLFKVFATLNPGASLDEVEKIIYAEIERAAREPVSENELSDIKAANRKGTVLARSDQAAFASELSEAEARADWRWLVEHYDDRYEAVTAADIMRVAGQYFHKENRTVGWFIPRRQGVEPLSQQEQNADDHAVEEKKTPARVGKGKTRKKTASRRLTAADRLRLIKPSTTSRSQPASLSSQAVRQVLPNGLTVLLSPNRGLGSVAVRLLTRAGNYHDPADRHGLSEIVGQLLTKGTAQYDKARLGSVLKQIGLSHGLSVRVDQFKTTTGATIPSEDLPQFLTLLADVVRRPVFPAEELRKTVVEFDTRLKQLSNDTSALAHSRLSRELYPKGHPYWQKPFDELLADVQRIDLEAVRGFHTHHYRPDTSILTVVGDVDPAQALDLVESAFGDWERNGSTPVLLTPADLPAANRVVRVPLADKASADIALGHPSRILRTAEDYYAVHLANAALGEDTVSSRLGKVVRDQHGLTYGIYSGIGETAHGASPWVVALTVNPANADRALDLVYRVLREYVAKGITRDELIREANGAAGSFTVHLRSSMGIAGALERFEYLGLDLSAADEHPARFLAVTKQQVDEAIREHLHPDRMVAVICGSLKQS